MRAIDDAVRADPFGGVEFLVRTVGRTWLERRLRDLPREGRSTGVPDLAAIEKMHDRHPLVDAITAQGMKESIAKSKGAEAISAPLIRAGYLGSILRDAALPGTKRLGNRLKDPEDFHAVAIEGMVALGYRNFGFDLDHPSSGPEFFVRTSVPVAVECKSKVRFVTLNEEAHICSKLCAGVVEALLAARAVCAVQITSLGSPRAAHLTELVRTVRTMLRLGIKDGPSVGGKYRVQIIPLPRDTDLELDELPPLNGTSVKFWLGGPPPEGFARPINPVAVAVDVPDRIEEMAERVSDLIESAIHNLPEGSPGVLYLTLPPTGRERTLKLLTMTEDSVRARLALGASRINAVVVVGVSHQDLSMMDAGLFLDGKTVLNQASDTPLPPDFRLLDHEELGKQLMERFEEMAARRGGKSVKATPAQARARGIFVPPSK